MSRGSWLLVTLGCARELLVDLLLCLVHEEAQGAEHRTCQHAREENQQDQSRASTAALWLGESFVQLARQVFVHFIHGPGSVDEMKRTNGASVQSNQGATSAPEHNKHELTSHRPCSLHPSPHIPSPHTTRPRSLTHHTTILTPWPPKRGAPPADETRPASSEHPHAPCPPQQIDAPARSTSLGAEYGLETTSQRRFFFA